MLTEAAILTVAAVKISQAEEEACLEAAAGVADLGVAEEVVDRVEAAVEAEGEVDEKSDWELGGREEHRCCERSRGFDCRGRKEVLICF